MAYLYDATLHGLRQVRFTVDIEFYNLLDDGRINFVHGRNFVPVGEHEKQAVIENALACVRAFRKVDSRMPVYRYQRGPYAAIPQWELLFAEIKRRIEAEAGAEC